VTARRQPHPLSTGFAWRPAPGPFERVTAAQAAAFDGDGFFLAEGVVGPATCAALVAAIDPVEAEVAGFLRTQPDGRLFIADAEAITFAPHLVARCDVARRLAAEPPLADLALDLVGPGVRLYWDQAVYKKPDRRRVFPWHQDNGYTFLEPQQYLTCWVALTDATVDNGCPWVVPGLHRTGTLRHWWTDEGWRCLDDDEVADRAVPVEAPAGSVVVFSSLTPHRTGPNRSGAVRKAYIVQYAPDGAETVTVGEGGAVRRTRQDHPDRQFALGPPGQRPPGGGG
jgi:hypothetical protein